MSALVDLSTKSYLYNTLQRCHEVRMRHYCLLLNVGVFLGFVLVFGLILYYCYRMKKLSSLNEPNKMMKDQQYILSKIRFYQEEQSRIKSTQSQYSSLITDLPLPPPHIL